MLKDDEHILFVAEADIIHINKQDEMKQVRNSGFACKKIVVTTQRLLVFQSLSNRLQETQYELTSTIAKKTKNAPVHTESKHRISVNGYPEISFDVNGFQSKVIIEEQPTFYKFLQKQGVQNLVKSVIGMVLLKIPKKMKYYILSMGSISLAIKFAKAIICAQSWIKYSSFCRENKIDINSLWIRILTEVIHNDESVILIDPDLFLTGSGEQIQTFIALLIIIPFAHCFHHRYSITTPEAASYASNFIGKVENKIHSLSFKQAHLNNANLKLVLTKINLANLLKIDLSENNLEDECLDILNRLIKAGSKRLSYINLSKNKIKLANPQLFVEVLKVAATILNLDLSYNLIEDSTTETFEKYVIFAFNPPLEELNLSHNQFSRKIAWRLYVGNIKNFKAHPYLKFLLYPIPIKKQVFGEFDIDFPRHDTTMNLNMHSALVEQFEQQSFLRHTFEDMPVTAKEIVTIKFQRVLASNVKLPMNRQQLNRTLQISHKIENFIYAAQPVEKIFDMAMQLKRFPFEIPPISRQHFIRYLYEKFNEALFIRDHYSVKYLFRALNELGVAVDGYSDRLQILRQRDNIFSKRTENLLNLQIEESKINEQLDELVREGLRLYLEGHGIELLYYLKYRRDQYIEKYLHEKLNPQHFLFDLMAKKNISADQKISEKQFIIPYEIRLQKKINENFYLHPWQANYQVLSEMRAQTFNACLQFLQESEKKEKFALYFDRIEERIEFIKNEFTYFSYNKFKASYSDLKINACRIIYLYNNIKDTSVYLEIPIYVKKRLVTPERTVVILNKEWFKREFHVVNYLNINLKARKANFYNYEGVICRFESEIFQNEARKLLDILRRVLHVIEVAAATRTPTAGIMGKVIEHIKLLIDFIRHSLVPEELKEELYLHLISWRRGRYGNNTELLELIPTFTMYIKPPLQIEKFLVAAILQNDFLDLQDLPLCLASNPNERTTDNVLLLENEFVERDWIPSDKYFCEVFEKRGGITLEIELLQKTRILITVSESKTVAELMTLLVDCVQMSCEDKQHFWLYKFSKENQELIPYESREHVGEIMADFEPKQHILLLKRRIYSRELRYNYKLYGEGVINSLYHDIKYEYMCRNFFVNDKLANEIAAILFLIEVVENTLMAVANPRSAASLKTTDETAVNSVITQKMGQLDSTFLAYVPRKIYTRLMKSKQNFVAEMKAKVSERFLKKEHTVIFEMKVELLGIFSRFPEFMSSNHRMRSKEKGEMQISVNAIYFYVEYEKESEVINLEKVVTIVPKSKYLLLYYHKQENIVAKLEMFGEERAIFALAMDILSYCSLRVKMSSINLYEIYHLEEVERKIAVVEASLKRIYDKSLEKDLLKAREEYEAASRKIVKMSLTLMNFKELQYWNKNHYIKSEVNRKLYANKTDKKLDFEKDFDEDEAHEAALANKKILQMIFPAFSLNLKEDDEDENKIMTQKKFNNDSNESFDFKKEYEKLNFETTNKKEESPHRQSLPSNSNLKQPPPPPPPIPVPVQEANYRQPVQEANNYRQPVQEANNYRQPPPPPPPMAEEDPEDAKITGKKARGGRVPRRRQ